MSSGQVDGTVRDRERGEQILSLLLEVVTPGTVVIVSSQRIRFDKSGCLWYDDRESDPGEGQVPPESG